MSIQQTLPPHNFDFDNFFNMKDRCINRQDPEYFLQIMIRTRVRSPYVMGGPFIPKTPNFESKSRGLKIAEGIILGPKVDSCS